MGLVNQSFASGMKFITPTFTSPSSMIKATGKPDLLRGRQVFIVDDVITTGATVNECARQMKVVGCGKYIPPHLG
ncbi:MAG: hypothetical protein HS103_13570 [Anaerolineales bacterium]|nr:hypothetical protein [Anaerolineales bacterium]